MIKKGILILFVVTTTLYWSCVDKFIDDNDRHYDTGVVAFNYYEGALYNVADLFGKVNDLNSFIGYVETNSLADGSNSLEVWQTAETEFFPDYRIRRNNGLWYLSAKGDTLLVIDTKNTDFKSPGSCWDAFQWDFPDAIQKFVCISGNSWSITLNDMNQYKQDIYYYEPDTYIDAGQLTVNVGDEGELAFSGEMTIFPLSYINTDGLRTPKNVLTGTISNAVWREGEYERGIFTEAEYTVIITDNVSSKTEPVAISITSGGAERSVEIVYKNDTVIL